MPEGPECRLVAEWLNTVLINRVLTMIQWSAESRYNSSRHEDKKIPLFDEFVKFLPLRIESVSSHGKLIIFRLSRGGVTIYMTNHLNMEGKWVHEPGKHSNLWLNYYNIISDSPPMCTEHRIYFDDSRKFGYIEFHFGIEMLKHNLSTKVGPDLLNAVLTGEDLLPTWKSVIRHPRKRNMILCDFLKNQKYFAGIGNYLRAEIMYEAGVSPFRKLGELTDTEVNALYIYSLKIMKDSYNSHGLTISTYEDPAGHKGTYNVKIYGKSTDPFGNPVVTYKKNASAQTIHWVPNVQK